jgi:hypothetical protein
MEPEQVDTLIRAAAEWGAKEQSSLNTALLSVIVLLMAGILFGARAFAMKAYGEIQEALTEIRSIKLDVSKHGVEINNLKERLD